MPQARTSRAQYSEYEAAIEVGVSIDELRNLVQKIAGSADEAAAVAVAAPGATFQASDLVMLKILARMTPTAA